MDTRERTWLGGLRRRRLRVHASARRRRLLGRAPKPFELHADRRDPHVDVQPGATQGRPADGRSVGGDARTSRPAASSGTSSTTTRRGPSCATADTRSNSVSSGFEQVAMREADRFVDTGQLNEFEIAMLKRSHRRPSARGTRTRRGQCPATGTGSRPTSMRLRRRRPGSAPGHSSSSPMSRARIRRGSSTPMGLRGPSFVANGSAETPASTGIDPRGARSRATPRRSPIPTVGCSAALPRLDAAIAARGRPAVVVIFSDHGTWIGADGGDIRLRFKNLLAIAVHGRHGAARSRT